jgi:hypothetical protein
MTSRDGFIYFADLEPSPEVLAQFNFGGDKGIMSLELLSIALGEFILGWDSCQCPRACCGLRHFGFRGHDCWQECGGLFR